MKRITRKDKTKKLWRSNPKNCISFKKRNKQRKKNTRENEKINTAKPNKHIITYSLENEKKKWQIKTVNCSLFHNLYILVNPSRLSLQNSKYAPSKKYRSGIAWGVVVKVKEKTN